MRKGLSKVLTFNSISISIGVLGAAASILATFISAEDLNSRISAKWLILACYVSLTAILVLWKALHELSKRVRIAAWTPADGFKPVRYIHHDRILVVHKPVELAYDSLVSLHIRDDEYEKCIGFGKVVNVQEKLMQIQVLQFSDDFIQEGADVFGRICANNSDVLKLITVRPSVPYEMLRG